MKKFLLSDYTWGALLTLLVLALFHLQVPFFDNLEHMIYDARARFRLKPEVAQRGDDIAIVAIDDDSINKIGRWPWPRSTMATLLNKLAEYQPKVVGLNILFSEPENPQFLEELQALEGNYGAILLSKKKKTPAEEEFLLSLSSAIQRVDNDSKLINTISETGNTVLAMSFGLSDTPPSDEKIEELPYALSMSSIAHIENLEEEAMFWPAQAAEAGLPLDEFAEGSLGTGHVSILPDSDGVIRRDVPFVKFFGKYYPSFPLQLARVYQGLALDDVHIRLGKEIRLGGLQIPIDSENRMSLSYVGEPGTFPYYSFFDVINDKVQASAFKNKIVLVGFTASGLGSLYVTPVAHNFPGVEYIANAVQNMLHKNFIVAPPWSFKIELGSILLVGLFVTLLLPRLKAGTGFLISLLLGAAIVAPAGYLFVKEGWWIKLIYPFFLLVVGYIVVISKKFFTTEKKKELVEASEIETNKMLGLSFQGQGQLDLAFEKFRKCPVDDNMKDVLYNLGLDFERKRQFNKAVSVYETISKTDPKFKDIPGKIDMLKKAAEGAVFGSSLPGGKQSKEGTVMLDSSAMKPTLGRYEILKELGRGAMGVVYLGKDPKINRTVAIKTMMFDDDVAEADLKDMKERFFREAESAGKLSHPNIVRIFDAGEDQDMAYIAMELMEGEDLKAYSTKEKLLPLPKVVDYVSKVADALDFAHQQGVFHRDIKPANIMLLKDGTVRVADFGIARIQGSSKTATGTVLGTPSYMSPEQIAGKKIDGRSDLFSLGVSLYELLTGEKPFKGGDAIGTLLFQIANDPHSDARKVRPEISEKLAAVIDRALTKDPDKRYQRGAEMAIELRSCL
ncbi:MAG: hypothetical protein A3A86_02615 [Elusimicrobia bacterium RIFCSPLOWO2_01_FULL_60_11]|nr:MAG: hypothetical protein A3A86_02615 [Elusimicrobia bacterium RIFCSPLOWO2_01_FULL_60_11]